MSVWTSKSKEMKRGSFALVVLPQKPHEGDVIPPESMVVLLRGKMERLANSFMAIGIIRWLEQVTNNEGIAMLVVAPSDLEELNNNLLNFNGNS